MTAVVLDGRTLSPADVSAVSKGAVVQLDPAAAVRMRASAALADPSIIHAKWAALVGGDAPESARDAIRAFVLGHCAGVGEPLPVAQVRAMMVCRANVLANGLTGCRPEAAQMLVDMLNAGVVPVVPRVGAVGVGGSIPLAHIVRVMARYGGQADTPAGRVPASEAMAALGPWEPTEKEGLSLINGPTMTAAMGALAVTRARTLLDAAIAACGLSFEVMRADTDCLEEAPLLARNHPGGVAVARRLRGLLVGSSLASPSRRPDPFSVRCAPQSLGAAHDTLRYVEEVVTRELNGAIDNPLVFADTGQVLEGGNFHGAPLAMVMDHLKAAVTQLGAMSERRLFRMTYGRLSGLPSFLVEGTGFNSGLMLAQYTAASLVSECKGLSHPASVDSVPTIQHHEDHVSMGPLAAAGALHILELLADVVAIELLCAAQGLDFHLEAGDRPAEGTMEIYRRVRERVPRWDADRVLHHDLKTLGQAVRAGVFA
ncbi:MAG: aromatic amino acid lyase [Alphaproteobacteria bacterium]|nr:aromatic amino acid lyase [Alphaproteobacteria bacterium]MCB9691239.1 aromatic amino acid lyase [Alphaproteobacteria bacterium]